MHYEDSNHEPTPILEEEENRATSTLTNTVPRGGGDQFGTAIVSRLGLELGSSKCNSTKAHAINKTFTRVLEAQPCNQDSCIDTVWHLWRKGIRRHSMEAEEVRSLGRKMNTPH
jgi:hypothetical protein